MGKKAKYPHSGLSLPTKSDQDDSIYHKPTAIQDWLTNLPLINDHEFARLLFKTLFEMNRLNMDSQTRFEAVEILRERVELITNNLKAHYIGVSFPLADKNRKTALLTRDLFREIALAYKTVISGQIELDSVSKHQKIHMTAVQRLMNFLGRILFNSLVVYEPYPRKVWHELHLLFVYSSVNKIDHVQIQDQYCKAADNKTVKQLYKIFLLLSASSPYQLRQTEIQNLQKALIVLESQAKLYVIAASERANIMGFMVDLHSDNSPVNLSVLSNIDSKQILVLETENLVEKVNNDEFLDENNSELTLSNNLKNVLLKNWGYAPLRKFVRTRFQTNLHIAIGLNHIHELISDYDQQKADELLAEEEKFQLEPGAIFKPEKSDLKRVSDFSNDEDFDEPEVLTMEGFNRPDKNTGSLVAGKKKKINKDEKIDASDLMKVADNEPVDKTFIVQTDDKSDGGYCLEWPRDSLPGIRVGELIGIQSKSEAVDFGLAITRWLRNTHEDMLLIGVEIISQKCQAVKVRADKMVPKHKDIIFNPGLFIPGTDEQPGRLLLPAELFVEGDSIILSQKQGKEFIFLLSRMIETTSMVTEFAVEFVSKVKKPDPDKLITNPLNEFQ